MVTWTRRVNAPDHIISEAGAVDGRTLYLENDNPARHIDHAFYREHRIPEPRMPDPNGPGWYQFAAVKEGLFITGWLGFTAASRDEAERTVERDYPSFFEER